MRGFLKDNGLSIAFGLLFLATLTGQAISGPGHYVTSALFWADVMENRQSEYLQFTLYIFATIYLIK